MAFMAGDFPFCGAAYALALDALVQKDGKLADYYDKFEDDEDSEFFMEEVIQKYHHYS